jgi:hypothetical protein
LSVPAVGFSFTETESASSLPFSSVKLRNVFRLTKEIAMKKYLLVAILAATFATPALATDSWYLSYNGKKCEIFAEKHQGGIWNTLAVYPSRQAAEKAKHKNDKCQKD